MDKENTICTHNQILFNFIKKGNFITFDNIDKPERQTKWDKSQKDKYFMIPLIWVMQNKQESENEAWCQKEAWSMVPEDAGKLGKKGLKCTFCI